MGVRKRWVSGRWAGRVWSPAAARAVSRLMISGGVMPANRKGTSLGTVRQTGIVLRTQGQLGDETGRSL